MASALEALKEAWSKARSVLSRKPLLRAISVSRQEGGFDFLLQLVRSGREQDALDAIHALRLHRESPEIARRLQNAAETRGGSVLELFQDLETGTG